MGQPRALNSAVYGGGWAGGREGVLLLSLELKEQL